MSQGWGRAARGSIHVAAIAPGFDELLHERLAEDVAQGRVHAAGHAFLAAADVNARLFVHPFGEALRLFEQAFSVRGMKEGRPPAAKWVAALDELGRLLQRCRTNPSHAYLKGRACAFCAIDRQTDLALFHQPLPTSTGGRLPASVHIPTLWKEIRAVDGGRPWFDFWHGPETVIFGHWAARGRVDLPLCKGLDTGCVYGGRLTGLWWPRREWVSVPAHRRWVDRSSAAGAG